MEEQLGPFQDIWDAWQEAHDEIARKPLSHFRRATDIQFDELQEHLDAGDREAAAREVVDIMSVALNVMRWLGHTPAEIGEITRARAEHRMKGQASQILAKYEDRYGI
ncbi:hypothetical protein ACOT81_25185 [Streptomyces sp. WI04-05B]|uniref:hypothetical protein n=1 Tax=Streptomyces TaxID=1883 RepID=UPI0029A48956|nr:MULTISPECIES: hypothetical protein [unclassified Streptomyces]MDX2548939.1 hypothetical protein [Streptomyces sp. WI04-05B]MDX2590568.1 hypothetical protein [Streptomyces sp. WI04-05A]MDX3750695.1 hypothetical protein [Streptomyces sp. AK08-02]